MKISTPALLGLTLFISSAIVAQTGERTDDLEQSVRSCRTIQMVLGARGQGPDIPGDDDFALAGHSCESLRDALTKSDSAATKSELAQLRPILARLGMPPATPKEQLAVAEAKVAKLSGVELFYELSELAKRSFKTGEMQKAERYAKQLAEMAPKYPKDWNYGNAIFDSNTVLGRIALRRGEKDAAGTYLLASGSTPGSPQLNSFGPSMILAKEYLDAGGQPDVVIKFLSSCKRFWELDEGHLDQWATAVRGGQEPAWSNLRD